MAKSSSKDNVNTPAVKTSTAQPNVESNTNDKKKNKATPIKGGDEVSTLLPVVETGNAEPVTEDPKPKPLRSYKQLIKSDKDKFVFQSEIIAVPIEMLYIEEGFNIRQSLDQDHIDAFTQSYVNGVYVPPLSVVFVVVDDLPRLKVIDGHHRYHALHKAQSQGVQIAASVSEYKGTKQQQVLTMLTSSEGRPLKPLEKAEGYLRLHNWGWKKSDICRQAGISQVSHDRLMRLYTFHDSRIPEMVQNGLVTADLALEVIAECDETGKNPFNILEKALKKAEKAGRDSVTRKYVPSKSKLPYKKQTLIGYLNSMSGMLDQINEAVDSSDSESVEQVSLTVPLDVAKNIKEMLVLWKDSQLAAENADMVDNDALPEPAENADVVDNDALPEPAENVAGAPNNPTPSEPDNSSEDTQLKH